MLTPMSIAKIIVIQPHTIYVSLKREQVEQALLLTRAVIHDLRESLLKKPGLQYNINFTAHL